MKKTVWLLFLICCGCAKNDGKQTFSVKVLSANAVSFTSIDYNTLANLRQDNLTTAQWQAILPLYRMPADTDMKDFLQPQPGKYNVVKGALVFYADTPFQKKQAYFARYYKLHDDGNIWALLKGKWKRNTPQYTECTFTP